MRSGSSTSDWEWATRVQVRNDGGRGGVDKLGGLAALRRRAADLGAHLTVEHEDGDFTVTLEGLS